MEATRLAHYTPTNKVIGIDKHNILLHDKHEENISNYRPPLAKTSDHYID